MVPQANQISDQTRSVLRALIEAAKPPAGAQECIYCGRRTPGRRACPTHEPLLTLDPHLEP